MLLQKTSLLVVTVFFCTVFFVILQISFCSALDVSEILFNPEGIDNDKEFIELQTSESLTHYIIEDSDSYDVLKPLQERNSSFALIVEEGFNYSGLNCSVYSAGTTIGNNLNNDADELRLYDVNGILLFDMNYSCDETCVAGTSLQFITQNTKNISISNISSDFNSWFAVPSPCIANIQPIFIPDINTSNYNETESINESINTTLTNQTGNSTQVNVSLCEYQLVINSLYYFDATKLEYSFFILPEKPDDFEIGYWISDYNGDIIKDKTITKNTKTKQYTPRTDTYISAYTISAELTVLDCNETNINNNYDERVVFYIGEEQKQSVASSNLEKEKCVADEIQTHLAITYVYEEKSIIFGKPLAYKLSLANRNDLSEIKIRVASLQNETLSTSSFKFFKGSDAALSQEIMLPSECTKSIDALLIVSAFGDEVSHPIFITCKKPMSVETQQSNSVVENSDTITSVSDSSTSSTKKTISLPASTQEITGNIISAIKSNTEKLSSYDELGDAQKQQKLLPLFAFICVLLTLILIARLQLRKVKKKD